MTSILRPVRDRTVFSTEERAEQTIKTIETVRDKIPNAYIVMIEGNFIEPSEEKHFSGLVDFLYKTDVSQLPKSPGEATLLHRYLTSDHFKSLKNIKTVSKISGRYYLDDDFNWEKFPMEKIIIKFFPVSWLKVPIYHTRYYRLPYHLVDHFIKGLYRYINSNEFKKAWPDIEHCFHYHNIIKLSEVYVPEIIGVCGHITGNNEFIKD